MKKLSFLFALLFNASLFAQSPSVQASNVQITAKTTSTATITWTRGNGAACCVVVRKSASGQSTPPSSTTTNYSASSTYGNGTSIGNGDNYVVYEGSGTSVTVSGLTANTLYYAYVYEYSSTFVSPNIYYWYNNTTSSSTYEALNTLDTAPTAASTVNSVSVGYTTATINVSAGTGADGRLIYVRPSSGSNAYPVDGYSYVASTTYGSGAALGGGRVVSSSTATSVAVSNLQPANYYYAYSHAYSDGTYPTSSGFNINSRNYYSGSGYYFTTANYPPTIAISGATSSSVCQDVSWQSYSLTNITDGSAAETQTVTLSGTSNNTTLIPNGNISISYNSTLGTATIYYVPAAGQYGTAIISITANDGFATTPTTTVNFTVNVNPKPLAAGIVTVNGNSGASAVPFCGGTNVSASIPAVTFATGYNWTLPAGCAITSGANTNSITVSTPTVSTITNYTLTVTPTNSCGNGTAATRVVQVDPNPTTPNAGTNQINLCGGTAFLSANTVTAPNVGNWETPLGTPAANISSSSSASTSITGLGGIPAATYNCIWTVTYTGSSCPAKHDTVVLSTDWAHPSCQPSANFNFSPTSDVSSTTVCLGTQLNFTDLSVSANQWQWDFEYDGSPNYTSVIQNPTYTYNTVGTYSVYLRIFSNATSQFYTTTKIIDVIGAPTTPGMIFGTTNGICANSPNQYAYSLAAVPNATNYNWTLPTGANIAANPSATSVVLMFAANAVPGNLSVNASNSCGASSNSNLMINVSPLPVMPGTITGPSSVCQGEQNVILSVPSITYATSYEWTLLDGSQITSVSTSYSYDIGLNDISGRVYVKGVNLCGDGDSTNFNLTINPLPANAGGISGNTLLELCPVANAEAFSIASVANATDYTWNLSAGVINSGTNTNAITVDFTGVTGNVTIQAIPSNSCGVRDSTPVFNLSFNAVPMVDVCIATVDSASLHNEVYWARPSTTGIDSFRVYRKLTALTDTLVATVAYEDETSITDTLSDYNPNSNFEEYTITAVDNCGNESQKSSYHRTMFLATSNGSGTVNLMWNLYVGQTVNFYQIYRDTTLAGNQWDLLDGAINPNVTLWVDNAPHPNGRYKVEVDWLTSCDPTRGAINTTRSNIKTPSSLIGIKEVKKLNAFTIAPNPASDIITLMITEKGNHTVSIIDALGKLVYTENVRFVDDKHSLDISSLSNGVYSVLIQNEAGKTSQLLIKQ